MGLELENFNNWNAIKKHQSMALWSNLSTGCKHFRDFNAFSFRAPFTLMMKVACSVGICPPNNMVLHP
jgi:hypothetical protein